MNGATLCMGMKRAEIDRKFDAIVAFSEVERFLDTQVKHYSTGMFTRLAFAVAAPFMASGMVLPNTLAPMATSIGLPIGKFRANLREAILAFDEVAANAQNAAVLTRFRPASQTSGCASSAACRCSRARALPPRQAPVQQPERPRSRQPPQSRPCEPPSSPPA